MDTRPQAERKEAFLAQLRERGSVYHATQWAKISRRIVYTWREQDAEFAQAWDDALEDAYDTLEASAFQRARDGVDEPVFYQGVECGVIRRYSDSLVATLLKGRRSSVFRDRTELSGPQGGPVALSHTVAGPNARELTEIGAILAETGALDGAGGAEREAGRSDGEADPGATGEPGPADPAAD